MSSNVGFNITMQRRGLPIAYMVSLGNRLKFDLQDAIKIFAQREEVTALGLYLEAMPDPKAFQEAVDVARELGKPIVAIKTGRSKAAQKMVVSHTASLAGSDDAGECPVRPPRRGSRRFAGSAHRSAEGAPRSGSH